MLFKNIYLRQFLFTITMFILFIFSGFVALSHSQEINPEIYKEFKHRHIGPIGNRTMMQVKNLLPQLVQTLGVRSTKS